MAKKSRVTTRQIGGDDGYQWCVLVGGRVKWNGMMRSEAQWRAKVEREALGETNPRLMSDGPKCPYCNDTGIIACRSRDGQYAFPGPVPDDAKGYFDANCWHCDSGHPPTGQRE